MRVKIFILFFIAIFFGTTAIAQSDYSKGFQDGYKKGYCYGEYGCIPPIPPITPILRVGERDDSYQDGYNRGFKLGLEEKQKKDLSSSTNSESNRERQSYYQQVNPSIPSSAAYQMPTGLMMQAALAARERYERNEQLKKERAIGLMNQVKSYYSQLSSYPATIQDGWHNVISMNNYDFCAERKVYVENNKVKGSSGWVKKIVKK